MPDINACGKYVTPRNFSFTQAFLALRRDKLDGYLHSGNSLEQAKVWTDRQWVAYYRNPTSGSDVLHASPKAMAELEKNGILRPRAPQLPAARKHWIPATVSRGCMAVNLDTKRYSHELLVKACLTILSHHADRTWQLPEDEAFGEYRTDEVIGVYAQANQQKFVYFDPRMAPHIREVIGIPAALPKNRRHWIPATSPGCSLIGVERKKPHWVALRRLCARLLDKPDRMLWLPHDRNRDEPEGWHTPDSVIRIYTSVGKPPVYYFDPRLLLEGFITKQAVRDEAAALTPQDLASRDRRLEAARRKMPPSAAKQQAATAQADPYYV